MELDDLKNIWENIKSQVTVKQDINFKMFDTMNKKKFHSILKKIVIPEMMGNIVCIGSAFFIGFNFDKSNTIAFQITGILSILLFVVLSVISFMSIQQLYKTADIRKSYADTLKEFTVKKIKFCKLQKLNLTLCYLLFVTIILLSTRLFERNQITNSAYFFILSYSMGYIILALFSKWVFKHYNKTIRETEDLLNELSSQ